MKIEHLPAGHGRPAMQSLQNAQPAPLPMRLMIAALLAGTALWAATPAQAQSIASGQTLWTSKTCSGCHGASPDVGRRNAADASSAVPNDGSSNIARAIANTAITGMGTITLTTTERTSIAMYIESVLNVDPIAISRTYNTGATTTISSNVIMNSSATGLNVLETVTAPGKGTVSYNTSTPSFTYTPSVNQCGSDSFTFRGRNSTNGNFTSARTVNVTIGNPTAPNITTSSATMSATVLSSANYSVTSTGGTPTSYAISAAPPSGLTFNTSTGAITGTPASGTAGSYSRTITAYNCGGGSATGQSSSRAITITVSKANQSISWTTPADVVYSPSGTFTPSNLATASSGLTVAYTSATPSVCTVSGTTVTKVAVGTCTLNANQAGDTNYNAATQVQRSFSITKASQTITFGAQTTPRTYSLGGTFAVSPTATSTSGLAVSYSSGNTAVCTVSGTTVSMVAGGTCPILANQSGDSNYNAANQVTQNVVINATVPGAPTGVGASAGDASAQVSFSAPASTGGSSITSYTASCSAGGQATRSASGANSPLTVVGLTNNVSYSCSVTATNAVGTGSASLAVSVTPTPTPVAPSFTSAASTSFTVLNAGTFNASASGVPAPTFSVLTGSLPSGVTLSSGGVLSGTPASGTSGVYNLTLRASNSAGNADQAFTLTIAKRTQSITFAPSDVTFDTGLVALSATATSGLTVSFASNTPAVCTVSGDSLTRVTVGTCQITASQAGNTDYQAATSVVKSFSITQGSQTVTFPAQTSPIAYPAGGSFAVNPVATASSGLAVSYSSLTPAVCSVAGTTVSVLSIGDCTVEAEQTGNANYLPSAPVTRTITVQKASQTITFAATQAAQTFVSNGTFSLNPLATASSGLSVAYSSLTMDVCTIDANLVTMANTGICTIAANQAGDLFYNAATQASRNITINPAVPGAPTIGTASAGNGSAAIEFLPPSQDGGSPVTSYVATCNPGSVSGNGTASPITVSGLTNGVQYSCSVAAVNAAGTGAASATVNVTPVATSGSSLWASVCTACHSATPSGLQLNGAGTTATVLSYVRANQASMSGTPAVQALSNADLALIAAYINDNVPNIVVTTTPNTAKTISVASHVTFAGSIAFNAVEVVTPPSNGSVGAWFAGGRSITYTPTNGFTGTDSFTYRPKHTTTGLTGDARTITIQVTASIVTLSVSGAGTGEGIINSTPFGVWNCFQSAGEFAGGVCSSNFPTGTTVTLNAVPVTGSEFTGWTGVSCAGGNSNAACTLTLSSGMSPIANFGPATSPVVSPQDLNDDGKSDLLWRNEGDGSVQGWLMNGTSATQLAGLLPAGGYTITHVADLDGNGKADTLISHTDGTTIGWLHDGLSVVGQATFFAAGSGWSIKHAADLDGDQKADLIVQHTDGTVIGWLMNGLTVTSAATFVPAGSGWSVSKVGDLDGDGKADLIWQHSSGTVQAWLMNGLSAISTATFVGPGSGWSVKLVADLNGDGKADLVWQNADGTVQAWLMNGTTVTQIASFVPAGTGWSPVLAGDLNADGKADLFWQHTDGRSQTWLMDGLNVTALAGFVGAGAWSATHLVDLNADGKRDILWRNTDGSVQAWLMDGLTITQIASLAGPGNYNVIPPRP